MADNVDHPRHYNSHPSGVECITITEHMSFNIGNAIKYLWRAGLKDTKIFREGKAICMAYDAPARGRHIEDLEKAAWYINREIERLSNDSAEK